MPQQSLKHFIKKNKITCDSELVANNPNMDHGDPAASHYRVVLKRGRKRMTLYFSKGSLHYGKYPETGEVLDCLASDSAGIENARGDFEEWASEYGYDTDSRSAEKIFKICGRQAEKLKNFLGDEAYEELLWNTGRE